MQSLKRSLRFCWSSSQMEANLEASDPTATELPPTYLRAFHSLIALDSSSAFLISWFSFERPAATSADPKKRSRRHTAAKEPHTLYWFRLPDCFQMWFETTRFVYFVKLKHVSRPFFDLKLQRTAFHSKNALKSAPRAPQEVPKRLQSASGSFPETS